MGYRYTLGRKTVPAREAQPDTGFGRVLFHKYYVDELYDRLIVRPLVWLSEAVLWKKVDQDAIDGVGVNGSAGASRVLGRIGSFLQSGYVGAYVVAFLVGALWILISIVP
jgi:NADH-quinone oxidoreductase subunit L